MKKYLYTFIIIIGFTLIAGFTSQYMKQLSAGESALFFDLPKSAVDATQVYGQAMYQGLSTDSLYSAIRVANYQLAAGSYFNWHSLPGGCILIVTQGEGYYQSKGHAAVLIRKGDRIETMAGLYHWIGATPDTHLSFIAVTTQKSTALINWHEAVTAEEYQHVSLVNKKK